MEFSEGLYRFALSAIHCSVVVKSYVGLALSWMLTSVVYIVKHKGTKLAAIQADTQRLEKIPLHLAVIVNDRTEHLSLDDLAKLVVWALASGVNTVSLYHPNDSLNDQLVTLRQYIERHHQLMFSPPTPHLEVTSSRDMPQGKSDTSSYGAGHTVLVLSPGDGRQRLAELARDLSTSVMNRQLRLEDLDLQLVGSRLTLRSDVPDPDLALVCGSTSSSLGYPPWQLRLTEIQSLPNHRKVTYQDFLRSLQRFSRCQRRFGK